jgi:tetratricopeptide (TPR) repeat protein
MKHQEYVQLTSQAAQFIENGRHEEGIATYEKLLSSDISDTDKAIMCFNLAVVYDKLGQTGQALAYYDTGIRYERSHNQHFVAEKKAAYLAGKGRYQESLDCYEDILRRVKLMENDKARIENNISVLKNQAR